MPSRKRDPHEPSTDVRMRQRRAIGENKFQWLIIRVYKGQGLRSFMAGLKSRPVGLLFESFPYQFLFCLKIIALTLKKTLNMLIKLVFFLRMVLWILIYV